MGFSPCQEHVWVCGDPLPSGAFGRRSCRDVVTIIIRWCLTRG